MVLINKDEKEAIRNKFPQVGVVRTMRQKSKRHRYYCEEAPKVMRYLSELRNRGVVERHFAPGGRKNKDGKDNAYAAGKTRR